MLPGMVAPIAGRRTGRMADIISKLGLMSGLKVCLDAGDSASYSSGQVWLDRSGNGYDFNRGSGSGSGSDDPTFNGTVGGTSKNEYFSLDGDDYFSYDSSTEAWMDAMHQDSALWAFAGMLNIGSSATRLFGNQGTGIGTVAYINAGVDTLTLSVTKLPALNAFFEALSIAVPTGDVFVAMRVNEAGNSWSAIVNGVTANGASCTYSAPSAGVASNPLEIGAQGGGTLPAPSGTRFYSAAFWQGTVPSLASLQALSTAARGKFGV